MKSRPLIFWTISTAMLLLCLFLPVKKTKQPSIEPFLISSLIKVEPKLLTYFNNKFQATVAGQLIMEIKQNKLTRELTNYDVIIIEDLNMDYNTQFSLHWQVEGINYSQILNHSTQSITPIDFKTTDSENINNLQLVLKPYFELNTQPAIPRTVSFSSIYFDHSNNQNIWNSHKSQWFAFNPVEINSINGYSSTDSLPLEGLILRLMLWLVINIFLYFFIKINGTHLIFSFAVAWLITTLPFISNFLKQHQQIVTAYPNDHEYINAVDKYLYQVAKTIKAELNHLSAQSNTPNKYVILGTNQFEYLRLFYHLTELNVGMSARFSSVNDAKQQKLIYILSNQYRAACNNPRAEIWAENQFSVLSEHPEYCLVEAL
ncbi:MAG: hypothetical protein R3E90_03775 [Marinicella sp.]|nr:hypothetical protein [Xanthomonadales bacterium]